MKTKIFIDFDGTLFDTELLKVELFELCESLGFSGNEIIEFYRLECADGLFSPDGLLERLAKIKKFNLEPVESKVSKLILKSRNYLFSDTIDFLAGLDRSKFEVDLMTLGNIDFQKTKVKNSGIAKYFDNIFYVMENKWEIMNQYVKKYEKFILIDDREDTILKISEKYPQAICLCIKRSDEDPDDPNHRKSMGEIIKIRSFNEALKFIED